MKNFLSSFKKIIFFSLLTFSNTGFGCWEDWKQKIQFLGDSGVTDIAKTLESIESDPILTNLDL